MLTTDNKVPGVHIIETRLAAPPIEGVGTSTAGFVGKSPKPRPSMPIAARLVTSADQFAADYILDATKSTSLSRAVLGFFENGGGACYVVNVDSETPSAVVAGLKLLEVIDEVAILAAPGLTHVDVYNELIGQATRTGDRFSILEGG